MSLPTGDGPPDGDFARYVDQLTATTISPSTRAASGSQASGAQAGADNAASPGQTARGTGVPATGMRKVPTGGRRKGLAGTPGAQLKAQLFAMVWTVVMVGVFVWFIRPDLLPFALIVVVGMFAIRLVRALLGAVRGPD